MALTLKRSLKVLDFDIENRPLTYWSDRRPSAEITAIASCWLNDVTTMRIDVLTVFIDSDVHMLENFVARYNEADMVTGHNIRKHDLPMINGALVELGMDPLQPKLTSDTYLDFVKHGDISVAQESLAEIMGIAVAKVHMTQNDWREANRLTEVGISKTKKRATIDVLQHMYMREELLRRGLLKSPKLWAP